MYVSSKYVELHAHSFYSFGEGASHIGELLTRAYELAYSAMALTDYNMCGALEFSRQSDHFGIKPITGAEIILEDNSHIVLLAKNRIGYSNISRLLTLANASDRREPRLDPTHIPEHASGTILLTGAQNGLISNAIKEHKIERAKIVLNKYREYFEDGSIYIELNRNFMYGDSNRINSLISIGSDMKLPLVATNNVHYHIADRYKLQNALTSIRSNTNLDKLTHLLKINSEFYLKSESQMQRLFKSIPKALTNTLAISDRCEFNLSSDLGYELPSPNVPDGFTPFTYLSHLCYEAAQRRYGEVGNSVNNRLREELRLIKKHNLAGFMLLYREIVLIAREISVDMGKLDSEEPIEIRSPGRGRGSSVAMLTGYLIGISHVDPLLYNLTLERFVPEDLKILPDIDIDFPRSIREKLIPRIHEYFGPQFAVLTGMITRYKLKGILKDLGKVFGIPDRDISNLSKKIHNSDPTFLKHEMLSIPEFKNVVDLPEWKNIISLASQLKDAPKTLGQHVGGMILSSSPISDMVPFRKSALEGRYIIDWDKDSIADAGFAKIDILSLPVLDQIDESISLIRDTTGKLVDISQVDPKDNEVFDMINTGLSKGVFLLQSPAQLKMGQRLLSRSLNDLAYQVALIRPGVGVQGNSVSQFIERYRHGIPWQYDHHLEQRALERTCGIIVWQEQVVQLISDISGISQAESDEMRRGFAKTNNEGLIKVYWQKFVKGAIKNGISKEIAHKIFSKLNGQYMFPESHSHAFAVSAYQSAWLKTHYPLEFYVSLMNNQPMGFYPLETIKQDARKFGVDFYNPDINHSQSKCTVNGNSLLIGLEFVKNIGIQNSQNIIDERDARGPFNSVGDFIRRVQIKPDSVESLIFSGAFDSLISNRRLALWESGLYKSPSGSQITLPISMDDNIPSLADFSSYEKMILEYEAINMYPKGHIMDFIRPLLPLDVSSTYDVYSMGEGELVSVCGMGIARQHPRGDKGTTFVTVEDESSDIQLILWSDIHKKYIRVLEDPIILATGKISRQDGTTSVVVSHLETLEPKIGLPSAHNWY